LKEMEKIVLALGLAVLVATSVYLS